MPKHLCWGFESDLFISLCTGSCFIPQASLPRTSSLADLGSFSCSLGWCLTRRALAHFTPTTSFLGMHTRTHICTHIHMPKGLCLELNLSCGQLGNAFKCSWVISFILFVSKCKIWSADHIGNLVCKYCPITFLFILLFIFCSNCVSLCFYVPTSPIPFSCMCKYLWQNKTIQILDTWKSAKS